MALTKTPIELSSTPSIVDGGNATAITIDSSENVGIGTSSPSATDWGSANPVLQISGTQPILSLKDTDVTDGEFQLANTGQNFYIYDAAASTTRLLIDSSGNVGIGTSLSFGKLRVEDTGWSSGSPYGTVAYILGGDVNDANWGHLLVSQSGTATGSGGKISFGANGDNPIAGIKAYYAGATYGHLDFYTRPSGGTSTQRMRIDSSGNVGIGTSSPITFGANTAGLTVNGSSGSHITWQVNGTNVAFAYPVGNNFYIGSEQVGGNTVFTAAGSERMRIDASGNLLVGKTVGNSPGTIGFEIQQDGEVYSTIATGFNTYHVYANSGYRFYVNPNGGLYNYSANNVNLSDKREKKNIEALESQWDSLKQWSLKKFHYNADDNSDTKKLGVIAQEVEVHNPELISEFSVDEDTTRMAVKEQQMVWMAIKALQEAQTRIETLEAKVQELENN